MIVLCNYVGKLADKLCKPYTKFYVEVYDIAGKVIHFDHVPTYRNQPLELIIYARSLNRSSAYLLWKEVSYAQKINNKEIGKIDFINAKTRNVDKTFYGISTNSKSNN